MKTFPSQEAIERHLQRPDRRLRLDWVGLVSSLRQELGDAFAAHQELLVDLRPFSILSADALVPLLALLQYRSQHFRGRTGLALPEDRDGLQYLADLGFLSLVQGLNIPVTNLHPALLMLEPTRSRHRRPLLFSLQPLSTSRLGPLAEGIKDVLIWELDKRSVSIPAGSEQQLQLFAFRNLLHELVHNTVKHAPERYRLDTHATVGYACYRPWPKTWPKLRFACSDLGDGFRQTLGRQKHSTPDDLTAIYTALLFRFLYPQEKVISLFEALSFLHSLKGRLWVTTGSATVDISLIETSNRNRFSEFVKKPTVPGLRALTRQNVGISRVPGVHYCVDLTLPMEADTL
ncbi:MAG: hypothetical protein QOH06_447 [Acidobacteriota bacterium]|jgi:hypothetical protein|nr:hypothetical protein [Acidobacteriota bacterium]